LNTVYFTDRDLGRQFPACLREAGIVVEEHSAHFDPKAEDDIWLQSVAGHGWIVITHDRRMRYKRNERDAIMRSGIALLQVIGNAPFRELAVNFVRSIDRIEAFLAEHQPPFIAKVYRPSPEVLRRNASAAGRVEMSLSLEDWSANH
jgi:hypothetical protein